MENYKIKLISGEIIEPSNNVHFIFTEGTNSYLNIQSFFLLSRSADNYKFVYLSESISDISKAFRLIKTSSIQEYILIE